ncbi:HET-domain-containing protein [Apiospora sp. TS-2023a]
MSSQRSAQNGDFGKVKPKPIEVDGIIYEPVNSIRAMREKQSRVSRYDDEDLKWLPEFRYVRLESMRRRIRLLRLLAGSQKSPDIHCELFEVEFDMKNVVRRPQKLQASKGPKKKATDPSSEEQPDQEGIHLERVEYEALSWNWGTESKDCGIRVLGGNKHSQRRLAVSRELAMALKYLRHPKTDRILWIDALCINQTDHEERNHQVQMMSRIYNCAQQVCVWLGQDNDDSTVAISFIREIMLLENFDAISEKKENAHKWRSLLLLMQRPWFSRKWVVQEIALARAATIYCGNDQIPWEQFAVAVELFVEVETATHRLSEVMRRDEAFGHVPQWFEHVSELGASVLVQATGKVFRRDGWQVPGAARDKLNGKRKARRIAEDPKAPSPVDETAAESNELRPQRPLLSLEYLVSSLSVFQASQPRDAIYSLLAISRDTSPFAELRANSGVVSEESTILSTVSSFLERKPFKVDYSRPFSDVCKDFVSFCIQGARTSDPTRALDILCRPWAPEVNEHGSGGVIHRKPEIYKLQANREKLWVSKKEKHEIKTKENDQWEAGNRTTPEYFKEAEKDKWDKFEDFAKRFLPEPKNQSSPNEDNNDEASDTSDFEDELDEIDEIDEETMKLPSWISPVSGAPFALFHHPGGNSMLRMGRKNADPLVGLPQDGHRNYSAAQNTKVDHKSEKRLRFRKRPRLNQYSLYTKGFIFDKIVEVREPARLGAIPETWTKLAGWDGAVDGSKDPPAEFWRTLVADRGKDNRNPPYYYATACKESVKKGGLRGGSVDTSALIVNERNSIVAEFCRRVQAVIWNRSLVKTEKGRLGLTKDKVRPGDMVCIIFGCTVPVILRRGPLKTAEDVENEKWQDCFESVRAALSTCEEACFRRLRYKRKLDSLGLPGDTDREDWKEEVQEEMVAVNKQMESWKAKELALVAQRKKDEEEKTMRKNEAAKRAAERKKTIASRAPTFRGQPLQQKSTIGSVGPISEEEDSAPAGGDDLPERDFDEAQGTKQRGQQGTWENEENAEGDKKEEEQEDIDDQKLYYTLISEAYIHGMMDGEAVREHILGGNKGEMRERMFEIR